VVHDTRDVVRWKEPCFKFQHRGDFLMSVPCRKTCVRCHVSVNSQNDGHQLNMSSLTMSCVIEVVVSNEI
jgi:hypothetical protein